MTNEELHAVRRTLFISIAEAANLIALGSVRTWYYYESGRNPIPEDIANKIKGYISLRDKLIVQLSEQQQKFDEDGAPYVLPFYSDYEDYLRTHPGQSKIFWRIYQSAVAFIYSEGGNVALV